MNTFDESLNLFSKKIPFRDATILLSGVSAIIFFQLIVGVDLLRIFTLKDFGRLENDFIFLVVAYTVGKLLVYMCELIMSIFDKLLKAIVALLFNDLSLKTRLHQYIASHKRSYKKIIYDYVFPKPRTLSPRETQHTITSFEMNELIASNSRVLSTFDRTDINQIFFKTATSATILAGYFYHHFYLIFSIVFLYAVIMNEKYLSGRWSDVFTHIVKKDPNNLAN